MGCCSSKSRRAISSGHRQKAAQYEAELSSCYKEACQFLPELRPFTASTVGDPDLLYFVNEYFKRSVEALKFLAAFKLCLAKVRDDYATCFKDNDVKEIMMKLKELKVKGDPFSGLFTEEFRLSCEQQKVMLDGLQLRKGKLDKKLSSVKSWRKVWGIAFAVIHAAVLACSVVFHAVPMPDVATASADAVSSTIKEVKPLFDSLLQDLEESLRGKREVIRSMYTGVSFVIHELESMRVLVEKLPNHVSSLSWDAVFTSSNEEAAVKVGVEEIKKQLREFAKSVDDLGTQVDECSVEMGKKVIEFSKIIAKDE